MTLGVWLLLTGFSGPFRDGVAAFIAVFAIPSIAIAAVVGLVALVAIRRSTCLGALALVTALAAAGVDWFALVSSVHICLE